MPRESANTVTEPATRTDEAAIRDVLASLENALRAGDVEAMLSHCADDIVSFDMLPPLEQAGKDAVRRSWRTALEGVRAKTGKALLELKP